MAANYTNKKVRIFAPNNGRKLCDLLVMKHCEESGILYGVHLDEDLESTGFDTAYDLNDGIRVEEILLCMV